MQTGKHRPEVDEARYRVAWWNEQWLIECKKCKRAAHVPDEPLSLEKRLELLDHTRYHMDGMN